MDNNTNTYYHGSEEKSKENLMMIERNAVKKAESMAGKINGRFSITLSQIGELSNHYPGRLEYGFSLFRLGYMQGMKAAKAEMKKKKKEIS